MMEQGRRQSGRRVVQASALACFLVSVPGCGGTTSEVVTDTRIDQYRIKRVAVLPFTVAPRTRGQLQGYATPAPSPEAAEKLAELFYLKLNAREGLRVISPSEARREVATIPAAPSRDSLREFGEKLGAGAVLEGTVEVYKQRQGSALGLERSQDSAEVGFAVRLVSTQDGAILWTGEYYEHQRPVIEDFSGFLERGARYLTVEELANSAVDHVLVKFPLGTPIKRPGGARTDAP